MLEIVGQDIIGFKLSNPKELSNKLKEIVDMRQTFFSPNSVLIHQVIKSDEVEYTAILYIVE